MRNIVNHFNKAAWKLLAGLFLIPLPIVYGQSNSLDTYKLVSVTNTDGRLGYISEEKEELKKAMLSSSKNWLEQLNLFGEKNYRVISVLSDRKIAIVKLDEDQYEYDEFETESPYFFSKSGIQENLAEKSASGFRIIGHSLISRDCEYLDPNDSAGGQSCVYSDAFLLEKPKSFSKPSEQTLVYIIPGWGKKSKNLLEERVLEKISEGYYPFLALSKYEVLLDKAKNSGDLLSDKPDVKVVTSWWGQGSLEKKVNELGKQGYRIGMTENEIVIMYRNSQTIQMPVSYIWLKAKKKSFSKDLMTLASSGASYKTTYPDNYGDKSSLIFEQPLIDSKTQFEFRVLTFDFADTEDRIKNKSYRELTSESKENVKHLNQLADEGFKVRDLFYLDMQAKGPIHKPDNRNMLLYKTGVILERKK